MKIAGLDQGALANPPPSGLPRATNGGAPFDASLRDAMAALEQNVTDADATTEGLVTGEVDIHEAMVAMEKADLTLRVAGTVRTKVIEAYQQLMQVAGG
jgi:flagellar hook-basal body complex protein FliE